MCEKTVKGASRKQIERCLKCAPLKRCLYVIFNKPIGHRELWHGVSFWYGNDHVNHMIYIEKDKENGRVSVKVEQFLNGELQSKPERGKLLRDVLRHGKFE